MADLWLNGEQLTLNDVVRVARDPSITVHLAHDALDKMEQSRAAVERFIEAGAVIYGITTGFGHFQNRTISPDHVRELQRNILMSHATGVGAPLARDVVRAMLLIRANTLAQGYSGIRPRVVQMLLMLLNADILPIVPCQGSLGASGDLAPLAHVGLILLGMGEATTSDGKRINGAEALSMLGLEPVTLEAKEGLAITNGTSLLAALAALAVRDAERACDMADHIAALSVEGLAGIVSAFDPRIHAVRPHPQQSATAATLRAMLEGSTLVYPQNSSVDHAIYGVHKVQDAYSLRCVPQVHGAVRDAIEYARHKVAIELNSVTDNPLILPFDLAQPNDDFDCLSGGNFHGEPLALAMDMLKVGVCELGNISERRIARLIDTSLNGGLLPPFLTAHGGLHSGMMLVQYTAAALASENKVLVHPASADTIPTSGNQEDHVSMGPTAARQALEMLENLRGILACEAMCAAQAVDYRQQAHPELRLGTGTQVLFDQIRRHVPFLEHDAVLYPHIEALKSLIRNEDGG